MSDLCINFQIRIIQFRVLCKAAKCVYKGVRFDVCTLEVKGKDGRGKQRDAILHPGAVVILPINDEKTIILIRNERFVVGERLWELPAGTLEPNEPPLETAKRELIEETGFKAQSMTPLMDFYSTPWHLHRENVWIRS